MPVCDLKIEKKLMFVLQDKCMNPILIGSDIFDLLIQ